ncbi:MAG: hypothetical protein H6512_01480 [Acidimicrobiia bacterium]|nr:hypothetical protein [Acidimicrobiia bacterium]
MSDLGVGGPVSRISVSDDVVLVTSDVVGTIALIDDDQIATIQLDDANTGVQAVGAGGKGSFWLYQGVPTA